MLACRTRTWPGDSWTVYGVAPLLRRGINGRGEIMADLALAQARPDPGAAGIRKDLAAFDARSGLPDTGTSTGLPVPAGQTAQDTQRRREARNGIVAFICPESAPLSRLGTRYACADEARRRFRVQDQRARGRLVGLATESPACRPVRRDLDYQFTVDDWDWIWRIADSLGPLTNRQRDRLARLLRQTHS